MPMIEAMLTMRPYSRASMSRPSPREGPVSSTMRFFSEKRAAMFLPSGLQVPACHTERRGDQANGMADAAESQSGTAKLRHLGRRRIAEILALGKLLRLARG